MLLTDWNQTDGGLFIGDSVTADYILRIDHQFEYKQIPKTNLIKKKENGLEIFSTEVAADPGGG